MADPTQNGKPADDGVRKWLALALAVASFVIVLGLGGMSLWFARNVGTPAERFGYAKEILGILLPVAGTWMGTIIAYYFSRENFESATRSTMSLVKTLSPDEKLRAIALRDAMIGVAQFEPVLRFDQGKKDADYKLKADLIDARLEAKKRERLPILDDQSVIKYVAHRSLIDRFIVKAASATTKMEDLTLDSLAKDADAGPILRESFRTLAPTATLADAKHFMDTIAGCSDVFVTKDGSTKSEVVGWVTDGVVLEKSRA